MIMTKYLQIFILVLHLSLIIRLSAVSQSQAYLINATDSIVKCNNSAIELKANRETLYAIPNIGPVSESLVGPDHTASGFVVTLSTGTIVNFFRLDPGFWGSHAGNNSMIVKRTSTDGGLTWTSPVLVYNDVLYDDRNVYGGKLGQDTIILFFRKYDAYTYSENGLYYIYSPDGGLTWSPLQYFNHTPNTCFGSQQVIPIPTRGYMMALYGYNSLWYYVELRFSHDGLNWDTIHYTWDYRVSQTYYLTEIQFTYCGNGRIIGFGRNQNGGYGDTFYQMVSLDYGYTWTQPTLTNIAAPFPCPAPSSFYDAANDDFWFIATDRRHYAGPAYSAFDSRVWLYKNKPSELIQSATSYTLVTSFLRPYPNFHMLYGYPIYTKRMDGSYLILFTESMKKSNYFEDADYYQFTISYDTISVKADHYLWSTGSTDSTILVNSSGIYKLTLTDSYGTEFIDSVFVNMLDFDLNQSTFSFIPGDTINPQITLNTPNELAVFNWSTGDTALSVILYPQNPETIYITGSNAFQTCIDSITLFAVYVPLQMGTAATVVNVSCFGGNNGSIIPSYSGGAYPIIFNWSHGASATQAANLNAGNYSVTISDAIGDSIIENYTILEPTGIEIQSTQYDVSSIGANDGAIFLSVSGGVSPYAYTWSNGSTSHEIYYMPAGTYSITITEANGCETYASFTIYEPELISAQTIQLGPGWSIISTYINPLDPSCGNFFSPIVSSILIVKNHLGHVYWPMFNFNQIGEVQLGKGYLIKLTQSESLQISGTIAVPENISIYCPQGWSLLGYIRNNPGEVSNMLSSLASNIILLKNSLGGNYWPDYGVNTVGNLYPGEGYSIKLTYPDTLVYPPNSNSSKSEISIVQPKFYNLQKPTDCSMTIAIPLSAFEEIPKYGDELGAFSSEGQLVGSAVFTDHNMAMTLWGDDATTIEKEGLRTGEEFALRLWSENEERTLSVEFWLEGDGLYEFNDIEVVGKISKSLVGNNPFYLEQNIPNPFSSITTVKFHLPEKSEIALMVYDVLGKPVKVIAKGTYLAGPYTFNIDAQYLAGGIYFYRLEAGNYNVTRQMEVIKN